MTTYTESRHWIIGLREDNGKEMKKKASLLREVYTALGWKAGWRHRRLPPEAHHSPIAFTRDSLKLEREPQLPFSTLSPFVALSTSIFLTFSSMASVSTPAASAAALFSCIMRS